MTSKTTAPLAPVPPIANHFSIEDHDVPVYAAHYFAPPQNAVELAQAVEVTVEQPLEVEEALALEVKTSVRDGCSINDRFDREALIAYEWDRKRLSLDVDGIGGGSEDSGMRLEYRIRLQPEKTDKQKCRHSASWQGLLGSGYNELVVREDRRVWKEIGQKRSESIEYLGSLF